MSPRRDMWAKSIVDLVLRDYDAESSRGAWSAMTLHQRHESILAAAASTVLTQAMPQFAPAQELIKKILAEFDRRPEAKGIH